MTSIVLNFEPHYKLLNSIQLLTNNFEPRDSTRMNETLVLALRAFKLIQILPGSTLAMKIDDCITAQLLHSSRLLRETWRDVESVPSTTTATRTRRRRRDVPRRLRRHPIFGEAPLVSTITHRGGVGCTAVDHRPRHLWARRDAWSLCRISPRGRTTLSKLPLGSRCFRVRACVFTQDCIPAFAIVPLR